MRTGKSKLIAVTLLVIFSTNTFFPGISYALTSGPTAPEATSFEPVDTTDMVNLQSGDLTYNIPLLEVPGAEGGYPLSLAYHSGIQPNEDASWVGLGWSLNPGAITRNVNGYADDWDNVTQVNRDFWKGGSTETWEIGVSIGFDGNPASVSFGLSFSQDTYRGFGVGTEVGIGRRLGPEGSPWSIGASAGTGPYGGISAGSSVSYKLLAPTEKSAFGLTTSMGISTNFESINGNMSAGLSYKGESILRSSISTSSGKPSLSVAGISGSIHNDKAGNVSTSSSGFGFSVPITPLFSVNLGYRYQRYWIDETVNVSTTGSMYMNNKSLQDIAHDSDPAFDCYGLLDDLNIVEHPDPSYLLGGSFPDFDNYSVSAQGLGGNFRPYLFQGYTAMQNRKKKVFHFPSWTYDYQIKHQLPGNPQYSTVPHPNPKFRFINDFSNRFLQSENDFPNYLNLFQAPSFDGSPVYGLNDAAYSGNGKTDNTLAGSRHIEPMLYSEIKQGGTFSNKFFIFPSSVYGLQSAGVSSNRLATSADPVMNSQIGGFAITNESGVTYHYGLPAYSYNEYSYTENIDKTKAPGKSTRWNLLSKPTKYAYTWYLTTMTGPDYVDRNSNKIADEGDWGYWVNFEYGEWNDDYFWRNPSEGFHRGVDNLFQGCTKGKKEVYYLNAIRTRTHTAFFEKELRKDGKSSAPSVLANDTTIGNPPFTNTVPNQPYGKFDNTSRGALRLSNIYIVNNADAAGTNPNNYNPWSTNGNQGNNILDSYDIQPVVRGNALRIIEFTHDYSLCKGTTNSFDYASPGTKDGKLTLKALITKARYGECLLPATKFQYELSPEDIKTGTITIVNDINTTSKTGTITVSSGPGFAKGDILTFINGSIQYHCVILSVINATTYKVRYLTALPPAYYSASASTTKNPPYNADAYDMWGMYKSDFDINIAVGISLNMGRENLARIVSDVSSKTVDAWSLRQVRTNLGAVLKMEYESDDYSKSILNNSFSFEIVKFDDIVNYLYGPIPAGAASGNIKLNIETEGQNLQNYFTVGSPVDFTYFWMKTRPYMPTGGQGNCPTIFSQYFAEYFAVDTRNLPNPTTIVQVGTDYIVVNNPEFQTYYQYATQAVTNAASCVLTRVPIRGHLSISERPVQYGGGLRVKALRIKDPQGSQTFSTTYKYTMLSDNNTSSGITTYEPSVMEQAVFPQFNNADMDVNADEQKEYKKLLYKDIEYLLKISREVPAPGVMYEYVSVQNEVQNLNEAVRPVDTKATYQFNVFDKKMFQVVEATPRGSSGANYYRNMAMKNFTASIGNMKKMIQWGKKNPNDPGSEWIKLSETINEYLDEGLTGQSPTDYVSNYTTRLGQYNSQGTIIERYIDARDVLSTNLTTFDHKAVMAAREVYPSIMMSQTVVDYKTGTKASTKNIGFDFYSGALTQKLEIDPYGNTFMTVIEPAYRKTQFASMGLKIGNYLNKNMLTQEAATYVYKVDGNHTPVGLASGNIQTWSNDVDVLHSDYSIIKQNNNATVGNVWRPRMNYTWQPEGSSADGLTAIGLVTPFDWNNLHSPGSQNAGWKKSGEISLYNVYSKSLEGSDINGSFAATRMGYAQSRVLASATPAKYAELAYSGAEDSPELGIFNGSISMGSASIVNDPTLSHTGVRSVSLNHGTTGFSYSVPVNKLQAGKDYFASVWVKSAESFVPYNSGLFYSVNGGSPVYTTTTGSPIGNGWNLAQVKIPAAALTSGTLQVGCFNSHGSLVYFDDFRFHPLIADVTSYVYDNRTGEITYILDNNNYYTKFEYDVIGRLVKTHRESVSGGVRPVNEYVYNHAIAPGAFASDAIVNQPFTKDNCSFGEVGSVVYITVPEGQFTSCSGQGHANQLAQIYAQSQANQQGNCFSVIYARVEVGNQYNSGDEIWGDVYLRFYSDASCTQPYALPTTIQFGYSLTENFSMGGSNYTPYYQNVTQGSTEFYVGYKNIYYGYYDNDPWYGWIYVYWDYLYEMMSGAGYVNLGTYYY